MKTRIPEEWKEKTKYSFRFHSYENMHDEDKHKERWWVGAKCRTAWTHSNNDINIDMNGIAEDAKECEISRDEMLATAISHEIIHNIITRDVDRHASIDFENICYHKNENFKEWFGGMA